MALYRYPQNDFDIPDALLNVLGSYWATTYPGNTLIEQLATVTGQAAQQTYSQLLELINTVSRFNVPLYHQDSWYRLAIKESEINTDPTLLAKYRTPSDYAYTNPPEIYYGVTQSQPYYSVTKPTNLVDVKLVFNRLIDPSVQLTQGIDFWLEDSVIVFRANPFNNTLIARRDILDNSGQIVDREMVLWLYRGQWDWNLVNEQFGYALRLRLQSSEGYKDFINAIFDAFCQGTSVRTQQLALAAALEETMLVFLEADRRYELCAKALQNKLIKTNYTKLYALV
jgi:hypothetical protein